jgi:hypothetical protein
MTMDLIGIVGIFVLSSTVALASAGGVVNLVFYAMGAHAGRRPAPQPAETRR